MTLFGFLDGREVALRVSRCGEWGAEGRLVDGRAAWLDRATGIITLDRDLLSTGNEGNARIE